VLVDAERNLEPRWPAPRLHRCRAAQPRISIVAIRLLAPRRCVGGAVREWRRLDLRRADNPIEDPKQYKPDAVSPRPGGSATRRWPTCGPGLRARGSRGRSGLAAARKAGRALGGAAEAATTVAAGAGDEVVSAIARGERGGEEGAARGRGSERGEDGLGFCCFYIMGE